MLFGVELLRKEVAALSKSRHFLLLQYRAKETFLFFLELMTFEEGLFKGQVGTGSSDRNATTHN